MRTHEAFLATHPVPSHSNANVMEQDLVDDAAHYAPIIGLHKTIICVCGIPLHPKNFGLPDRRRTTAFASAGGW
jgi:hypothetical protein